MYYKSSKQRKKLKFYSILHDIIHNLHSRSFQITLKVTLGITYL